MFKVMIQLSSVLLIVAVNGHGIHWNHNHHGKDWGGLCRWGKSQSPVDLAADFGHIRVLPRIRFHNYDKLFHTPSKLRNNGYTASMKIGRTYDGHYPSITGAHLNGKYIAEELHFHWGTGRTPGSEHKIYGKHFDIEMHIVHRKETYPNLIEAEKYSDGLAVLGIVIKIQRVRCRAHSAVTDIFKELPSISAYKSITLLSRHLTIGVMLKELNTRYFFAYEGSLTTPECTEDIKWIVFKKPLIVPSYPTSNLLRLKNFKGHTIANNYRYIQPLNKRRIPLSIGIL